MVLLRTTAALLVILLFTSRYAYAQKPVPGYVVTAGRDSLLGAIQMHNELDQQLWVEFIPLQGLQRIFLDATQLAAYGFVHKKDTVRYVAMSLTLGKSEKPSRFFLREILGGPVRLYDYRYVIIPPITRPYTMGAMPFFTALSRQSNTSPNYTVVVHRKGESKVQDVRSWDMAVEAAQYFADYPELAQELRTGRYKQRDITAVVRRYNTWRYSQPTQP